MPVTYADLDDRELGRQVRIASQATDQIAQATQQAEIEAQEAELVNMAEANVDAQTVEAAKRVIADMDSAYEQGIDPQQILNSIPEEIALVVVQLLEQEALAQEQQDMAQQSQQAPYNQQSASITDQAKRIATNL